MTENKLKGLASKLLKSKGIVPFLLGVAITGAVMFTQFGVSKDQEAVTVGKEAISRVIDGDTVEINAPYLPEPLNKVLSLRIHGVNTPESDPRAKCPKEAELGAKAKAFVEKRIKDSTSVVIILEKWDKFGGRVLGDLKIDNERLSKTLLDKGLASEYNGRGAKKDWCK